MLPRPSSRPYKSARSADVEGNKEVTEVPMMAKVDAEGPREGQGRPDGPLQIREVLEVRDTQDVT